MNRTDLLVYCSAIYPQWTTFRYGLGGRQGEHVRKMPVTKVFLLGTMFSSSMYKLTTGKSCFGLNVVEKVMLIKVQQLGWMCQWF